MGNYNDIKNLLESNVFQNTSGAITGTIMQDVLLEIINTVGVNSGFMGILSSNNKPTATVDGKQFYIGYNVNEKPLNIELQSIGRTLTIRNDNLYIVYNNGGGWLVTDIAQGIATKINAHDDAIALLDDERVYMYQSLGVCLVARSQYEGELPNIAKKGKVLIIGTDDNVEEASLDSGGISVKEGERVWLLPAEKMSPEVWDDVAQLGIFSLFIPSGCPVYNFFAKHTGWGVVGVENFGLSKDAITTYRDSRTTLLSYGNYYSWYSQIDPDLKIMQYADREELLSFMCNMQ